MSWCPITASVDTGFRIALAKSSRVRNDDGIRGAPLRQAVVLVVALVVGLMIGIFQAATSINEQTLSFIPKLLALGLTAAVFGTWMINTLVDYTKVLYGRIPGLFG